MKGLIVFGISLVLLFIPVYLFVSSCDSAGTEYYINFTMNGTEYSCDLGFTDVDQEPFGAVQPGGWTYFSGTNTETSIYGDPVGDYVRVQCNVWGSTAGFYMVGSSEGQFDLYIEIVAGGVFNAYEASSGTLEITSFGEVGGVIEGNFEVRIYSVLSNGGVLVPLAVTIPIEGTFSVKRVEFIVMT